MTRQFLLPALISAVLLTAPPAHSQEREPEPADPVVYVQGIEKGQGITRGYRGECFVITPEHVVFGPDRAKYPSPRVYIVIEGGKQVNVDIMPRTSEFTILRVPDAEAKEGVCATPISLARARTTLRELAPGTPGAASERSPMGQMGHRDITVSDKGDQAHLEVAGDLGTGTSGSLIYIGQVPIGVVVQTPVLPSGDPRPGTAEVYRLDHMETFVASFFRYRHRPGATEVVGSVFMPGLGQRSTTRVKTGAGWMALTLAAMVGVQFIGRDYTEIRTFDDPSGIPRPYEYRMREYRYRNPESIAKIWFISGFVSAAETVFHVSTRYPAREGSAPVRLPDAALRLSPRSIGVEGEMGVAVSVEMTF
jgi:hypothetical protein